MNNLSLITDEVINQSAHFKQARKRWRRTLAQGSVLSAITLLPLISAAATIQGTTFMDNNNNGVLDAGEPPRANTTIFIRDETLADAGQGGFFSTSSDANGQYISISHNTGPFTIWSAIPSGWEQTTPVRGEGFVMYDTNITSSTETLTVNFGFFDPSQQVSKTPTYLLTATKTGTGKGSITGQGLDCGSDCTEEFQADTKVTLNANPDTLSTFAGWSGACSGSTSPCYVTMTQAQTVTAKFNLKQFTLLVNTDGNGNVTGDGIECGNDCTEDYDINQVVTLTAKPDTGETFSNWSGACSSIASPSCQVTMNQAQDITAIFKSVPPNTLRVQLQGNGTIISVPSGINCGSDCDEQYTPNTSITLTATPDKDYVFANWSGACQGNTASCTVNMSADQSVTATFDYSPAPQYALNISKTGTGNGSVAGTGIDCGADCTENYVEKTAVTLTAKPAADSSFVGWNGACSGTGTCQITMTQAQKVTATFNVLPPNEYPLTISKTGTGNGSVTGTGIDCGTDCTKTLADKTAITLTAKPAANSTFGGWGGDCSGIAACQISMTKPQNVTATFDLLSVNQYQLTVQQTGTGSGTIAGQGINCGSDCSEEVPENNVMILTATANPGSIFTGWNGAGCSGTNACTVTLTTDRTVTAGFEIIPKNQYALSVSKTGKGTVTGQGIDCGSDCTEQYVENTEITLTASPAADSSFIGWSGACSGTGACTLTMNQAQQVSATFQANGVIVTKQYPLTINKTGKGTISGLGINCGTDCSESYLENSVVSLTALPDTGFSFSGWQGAGCSGTGICSVTMTQAETVTATFEVQSVLVGEFVLTINHQGTGNGKVFGQGLNCRTDCTQPYPKNTDMLITATPEADSKFVSWGGACKGTAQSCRVVMTEAKNVIVTFELIAPPDYLLTVNKQGTGNGTITGIGIDCGSDCTENYAADTPVTLTAIANNEATFVGWSGACSGTLACQVTLNQVQTVTAIFNLNQNCTYRLEPNTQMHGANADTSTVKVIAPTGCEWQVTTDDSWLTAKASGNGNGSFNYTVAPNSNSTSRTGNLTLADQSFSVTQTGNVAPTAHFTASPLFGEAPMTVKLDASASTDQEGSSGLTYQWTISDGRTLSGVAPEITFTEAGQYSLNLVVTNADQAKSQKFTQSILVENANQAPIATFTLTPNVGKAPLRVDLEASQSSDPDGRIINYQWASSEGQKTLGQKASLTFNDTGTHTLTLTVIDNDGEQATAEQTVVVEAPPPGLMAAFRATPTEGEAPLTVTLDASDSAPQSAISQYEWNTTDGQITSGRTGETFTFTDPGKYLITLTITGKDGTVKNTQKTVLVKAKPVARFIAIPNVVKLSSPEVQLDASDSFDPDGTVVDYRWTTSDAQKASGKITSLFFKTEGQYEIELVVTDDAGLKSINIARQTITVVPEEAQLHPVAIIDVDDKEAILQRTVKFSAKRSRDIDGKIVQYDWTSSDNQKASGEDISLTFAENGDYTITLTVTDDDGLTAQEDSTISVGERVIVEFQGLKPFYEVGETLKVDLIEDVQVKSRFDRVDLWVGIQIPNGNVLFKTPLPLKPFDIAAKPFKASLETLNVAHRLLEFEVIPGLGGEYILYALYVREGETPFGEGGYQAVQRSNLARQSTILANFANFGLHQAELEALEASDLVEDVIVKANGEFSFKFEGITHYGKLGQITQGMPPSNGGLNIQLIDDANDDGIPDLEFTYSNGDKQIYYYLGFYE